MGKLTAKQVEKAPAGRHWDDARLMLQVAAGGSKQWLLRYALRGKTREMGLGAYPRVSLKGARQEATEIKNQCAERIDPLVEDHKATWSPRHAENWLNGMAIHVFEILCDLREDRTRRKRGPAGPQAGRIGP
jgi:hypothetical protein